MLDCSTQLLLLLQALPDLEAGHVQPQLQQLTAQHRPDQHMCVCVCVCVGVCVGVGGEELTVSWKQGTLYARLTWKQAMSSPNCSNWLQHTRQVSVAR